MELRPGWLSAKVIRIGYHLISLGAESMDDSWRAEQATYTGQMVEDIARALEGSIEHPKKRVQEVLGAAYTAGVVPFLMYREVADMYLVQLDEMREQLEGFHKRAGKGGKAKDLARSILFCERLAQIIGALRDKTTNPRIG